MSAVLTSNYVNETDLIMSHSEPIVFYYCLPNKKTAFVVWRQLTTEKIYSIDSRPCKIRFECIVYATK